MRLKGKVAFITGAGRGIGRSIAIALARDGANVAVTGRTKERRDQVVQEIVAAGGDARAFVLDVTKDEEVVIAVQEVLETWGQIDVLVNSAGIIQYHTPVWETTIKDWDTMMEINLRGTFLCCHAVVPHMVDRGEGKIINIASSSARMADDDLGPYTASKWAVAG